MRKIVIYLWKEESLSTWARCFGLTSIANTVVLRALVSLQDKVNLITALK